MCVVVVVIGGVRARPVPGYDTTDLSYNWDAVLFASVLWPPPLFRKALEVEWVAERGVASGGKEGSTGKG